MAIGHPELIDYTATKGAMIGFMRALSNQIVGEKGVRCNAVAPGPIWTPLMYAADAIRKRLSCADFLQSHYDDEGRYRLVWHDGTDGKGRSTSRGGHRVRVVDVCRLQLREVCCGTCQTPETILTAHLAVKLSMSMGASSSSKFITL